MLTPEQLDEYMEPFMKPGADPKAPDLDRCDATCLFAFLFDAVIGYEAAAVALMHSDPRGVELARRTLTATKDTVFELSNRLRGHWTVSEIERFLREQAE